MLEDRIRYAIDNFIDEGYFLQMSNEYVLHENAESGESQLHVIVNADNICVEAFDDDKKKKCNYLKIKNNKAIGLSKCVDHVLLKKCEAGWKLCLIEMKTSLGYKTWADIKKKIRASYFNALSLCVTLGVDIKDIEIVTTYELDKFIDKSNRNPAIRKSPLGFRQHDVYRDEFLQDLIRIQFSDSDYQEFPHTAVRMIRNNQNILMGEYALNC